MQVQFFPSGTIAWYVARLFLVRTVAILAALILVLQTLDLLGESDKILAYAGNDGGDLWRYVSLRVPQLIARFLPFSVLLATIVTLATLNQNSEVVSMKGAGLSAHQVLAPLILASLGIAAISFAFNDRIVARATHTLDRWEKAEFGPIPGDRLSQTNVWVRDGNNLINVAVVTGRGDLTRLSDITIYDRSGGALAGVVKAESGTRTGNGWQFEKTRRFDVARGTSTDLGTVTMGSGIRPDQFTLASVDGDALGFADLWDAIGDLEAAGRPTGSLRSILWHKISGPLSTLLMPLLGAMAAFGTARSGRLFVRAVVGMGLGFAYFVVDNLGLAMGSLGAYPPVLAAWGPFFLFLLIGEFVLFKTEE